MAFGVFTELFYCLHKILELFFITPERNPGPSRTRMTSVLRSSNHESAFCLYRFASSGHLKGWCDGEAGGSERVPDQLKVTQLRKGQTWDLNPDLPILQGHTFPLHHGAFLLSHHSIKNGQLCWWNPGYLL